MVNTISVSQATFWLCECSQIDGNYRK